jgi:uncharacterized protein (TIGR00251 family)
VNDKKTIRIKAVPNAKRDEIIEGEPLTVRVKAPPIKGQANKAIVKLLSKHFNARIRIISGMRSKNKVVEIEE